MRTRVISGTIIGIIAVICGITGGPLLSGVLFFCAVFAYDELLKATGATEHGKSLHLLSVAGYIAMVMYYVLITYFQTSDAPTLPDDIISRTILSILIILLLTQMIIYVLTFPRYRITQVVFAFFCFLYGPVFLSFIYLSRELKHGMFIYALIFFCSWICDTCAYFAGWMFGKHKMAPVLSPKKTIEGAIGGVLGSVILCTVTGLVMSWRHDEERVILPFVIIGLFGSLLSMIGDLAASAIKRNHDVKDYGNLIPGHGGIMDRFDSVIFIAPVIYYLAVTLLPML